MTQVKHEAWGAARVTSSGTRATASRASPVTVLPHRLIFLDQESLTPSPQTPQNESTTKADV